MCVKHTHTDSAIKKKKRATKSIFLKPKNFFVFLLLFFFYLGHIPSCSMFLVHDWPPTTVFYFVLFCLFDFWLPFFLFFLFFFFLRAFCFFTFSADLRSLFGSADKNVFFSIPDTHARTYTHKKNDQANTFWNIQISKSSSSVDDWITSEIEQQKNGPSNFVCCLNVTKCCCCCFLLHTHTHTQKKKHTHTF